MWLVYLSGSAFIIITALLTMCIVAGWADEDMKRMMERGDSDERKELFETTEEAGLHDHE